MKKYLDLKKKVVAKKFSGVPRTEYAADLAEIERLHKRLKLGPVSESEDDISSDDDTAVLPRDSVSHHPRQVGVNMKISRTFCFINIGYP